MRERTLADVARAVEGSVAGDDVRVTHAVTDSRQAGPGALFFALHGERTDGHLFVGEAFAAGAAAAVVRDPSALAGPGVCVPDTGGALLALAADERRGSAATVVGVTGANGKTSTKD
ncbi:MAG: Mur ligase domain-containing protein, partial [Actinomycetota bacterium]